MSTGAPIVFSYEGVTESIKGTILDFTEPHSIGERSAQVKPRGYDANYVLNTAPKYDKDDKLHFVGRYVSGAGYMHCCSNM